MKPEEMEQRRSEQRGLPDPVTSRRVAVWTSAGVNCREDEVATEVPVALVYNGVSHAVMMATPEDLLQFAVGFSLSERIVDSVSGIYEIEVDNSDVAGVQVLLTVSAESFARLKDRRRALSGRTGCGLCGVDSLQQANPPVDPVNSELKVRHMSIDRACQALKSHQPLQGLTGGLHAAAWCNVQGEILRVFEDVGRHNALDKLIGWLAEPDSATRERFVEGGFLLMSSRSSHEIVNKAAIAGIAFIASVSAPTSLALEIAERAKITLVGFTRSGRHVVYTHPRCLID